MHLAELLSDTYSACKADNAGCIRQWSVHILLYASPITTSTAYKLQCCFKHMALYCKDPIEPGSHQPRRISAGIER